MSFCAPLRQTVSVTLLPGLDHRDDPRQLARRAHVAAVGLDDDVAGLDARLVGRAALLHRIDERAARLRQAERLGGLLASLPVIWTPIRPRVTLPFSLSCVDGVHRDVDRDREREPHVAAGAREDQRVDADDLALEVEQRAARVARIDRGVGLDERARGFPAAGRGPSR